MPSSTSSCVVDASFVVRLLQPGHPEIVDLWQQWRDDDRRISAPALLVYEATNAFYRLARTGGVSREVASATLDELTQLNIEWVADTVLSRRAIDLGWSLDLPAAYDAHYLALAERLDCVLWTCDKKLAERANGALPRLEVAVPGQSK